MRSLLLFSAFIPFASCNEHPPQGNESGLNDTASAPPTGCFLGHAGNSSDTLQLRLDPASADGIRGDFRIALKEKDQRIGSIQGIRGTDGIYRATFRFMQEGMTDSVQLHLREGTSGTPSMELRPSAYDAVTGREYPDSAQPFSIRLVKRDCE